MNKITDQNEIDREESYKRPITLILLGMIIIGACTLFITAFNLFQPDQLSLSDRYFPSPTATFTPTLTPTPTPNLTATQQVIRSTATAQAIQVLATDSISKWPVLFTDPFDTNNNQWDVGVDEDDFLKVNRQITNGKYQWDATAKKGFIAWIPAYTKSVSNFHLSADIEQLDGSSQSDYGLIFREDANSNFYYFGIDRDGFFVSVNYNSDWSDLIEFTVSSAILPKGTNRLTVIAEGSHFIFFINDHYVGEMTDDQIKKGTTAIAVELHGSDLQATIEFDNFELRAP